MAAMDIDVAPKRTFKEKLLDTLAEAEVEAQVAGEAPPKDKQVLLVEMLVEGFPSAFCDFFYLTHRDGIADDQPTAAELEAKGIDPEHYEPGEEVPEESLGFLKENLVVAEAAQRRSDMRAVFDAYKSLATYFESTDNPKKAIFFFKKCLEVAVKSGDVGAELEANVNLGMALENTGDTPTAIEHHERHVSLATSVSNDVEELAGHQNLVRVYRRMAEEKAAAGDMQASIECLEKCLAVARLGMDVSAEGLANHKLGLSYEKLDNPQKALGHHGEYLRLCKLSGDKAGEGTACCALAGAHQAMGDVDAAVQNLETFLELSKNGDPASQARACCSLGNIYTAQKKFERAVTYFEKFFEVARSLNDRRMLDVARINLGVARGSARTGRFMEVVSSDLNTLLLWKNVRMPIDPIPL